MPHEAFDLPLVSEEGRTLTFSVWLAPEEGWDVCAALDDRVLARVHCRDWHRVERFRARLEAGLVIDCRDAPRTPLAVRLGAGLRAQ